MTPADTLEEELLDPAFISRIERLQLRLRRINSGDGAGDFPSSREGMGTLFREYRAYAPGDDPRRLDWNAFLRLGDLLTITTESEEAPRVTLFIDHSASMGLWGGAKRRHAAFIAAGIGTLALLRGAALHLHTWPNPTGPQVFRGRSMLSALLRRLAAPPSPSEGALLSVAESATHRRPTGPAIFLSDFLETRHLFATLRSLRASGFGLHLIRISDPRDVDLPPNEPLHLTDVETNRTIRVRLSRREAAAYTSTIQAHLASTRATALRLAIPFHETPISTPPESTVLSLLRTAFTN